VRHPTLIRRIPLPNQKAPALALALLPESQQALTSAVDFHLRLWDLEQGICLRSWDARGPFYDLLVGPSADWALLGAVGGVVMWDLEAWYFLHTFPSYEGGIHSLVYVPERDLILAGSENSLIYRWKRAEREKLPPLTEHDYDVTALVTANHGQVLISGDMLGSLRVWDLETGSCIRSWRGHNQTITGLVAWNDSPAYVSASRDGTLRFWDMQTGECVRALEANSRSVEALVVDMSRQQLIAGNASGAHSWSLTTFEHLWSIEEPDIVDLSVDGHQLVTLGCRSGLSVWHLPAEQADHDRPINVISV